MPSDVVQRFYRVLPQVRGWIETYLERHAAQAQTVHSQGIEGLAQYYPVELLSSAKSVVVSAVEFPPVHMLGLPEFNYLQRMSFDGITFKDTYFLRRGAQSPALHFHELVHVVQWARLGVDNFILAYGAGLLQGSYEKAPFEQMAYRLQADFERRVPIARLVQLIEQETDAIWQRAQILLQ
jgi:hypothetical protein